MCTAKGGCDVTPLDVESSCGFHRRILTRIRYSTGVNFWLDVDRGASTFVRLWGVAGILFHLSGDPRYPTIPFPRLCRSSTSDGFCDMELHGVDLCGHLSLGRYIRACTLRRRAIDTLPCLVRRGAVTTPGHTTLFGHAMGHAAWTWYLAERST